jgi:putative membrane protein
MSLAFKLKISIGLIWLFTICGLVGILSPAQDWFLVLTPINLLLSFLIMVININEDYLKITLALLIPFLLGFITEALGVNYGLIFGDYSYGENLGFKVFGVPLIICINWAMLTAISADVAKFFHKNIFVSSFVGALIMTILDLIIEVSAPRFDFWEFNGGVVPIQNYLGWFFTAFVAHLGYQYFKIKTNSPISWHLLISITFFFTMFLFF